MPNRKGKSNVHTLIAPEFHPFTPTREPGTATEIEQPWTRCGEGLWTYQWNRTKDMITCLNDKCPAWKQPVSGR